MKATQGGLKSEIAKLRYVRKRPLQEIYPNFYNYFEMKSTSSICILIFSIGNELLQVMCVTVKFKTIRHVIIRDEWLINI